MKTKHVMLCSTAVALMMAFACVPAVHAQTDAAATEDGAKGDMMSGKKWDSMSQDEKKAAVEKRMAKRHERHKAMKEKWEKMSPEERAKAKERMKDKHAERKAHRKEKLAKMSPEEREKAEARMKERKEMREQVRKDHPEYGHKGMHHKEDAAPTAEQ